MGDPGADGRPRAADPGELAELVGAQSLVMLRAVSLLLPGIAATGAATLVEEVWAEYLASLFDGRTGGPVATGLLTVLVHRTRALAGPDRPDAADAGTAGADGGAAEAVPADRFEPDQDPWAGTWREGRGPRPWAEDPRREVWTREAVEALPLPLREVLVLRDTAGLTTAQVAAVLRRPGAEVRAMLHRARTSVWAGLERRHAAAGRLLDLAGEVRPADVEAGAAAYPGDPGHRVICHRLVQLLTDYLDGALGGASVVDLEAHLAVCPECRLFVRQLRSVATTAQRLAVALALPPAVVRTVARRLHAILDDGPSA